MANEQKKRKLRLITYMVPGIPLGLYQTYQHYLEEVLDTESYLMVESRTSGPMPNRDDPFTLDDVDIGFMCSTYFLRMLEEKNQYVELLPVAPIHHHSKSELRPVYFADVIIHKDKSETYTDFEDLKGHTWAYNDPESLSGNISTLRELKKRGVNASFFGNILQSGSHLNSIQMVMNHTADAAAIDSIVLSSCLLEHPEYEKRLHVLRSWGPLPIPPVVVNARMPGDLKQRLVDALLKMNTIEKWNKELAKYKVWGFKENHPSTYDEEKAIKRIVKNASLKTIYY